MIGQSVAVRHLRGLFRAPRPNRCMCKERVPVLQTGIPLSIFDPRLAFLPHPLHCFAEIAHKLKNTSVLTTDRHNTTNHNTLQPESILILHKDSSAQQSTKHEVHATRFHHHPASRCPLWTWRTLEQSSRQQTLPSDHSRKQGDLSRTL